MKFTLTIDPTVTETIVKVTAREVDAEVQAIQRLASGSLDSSSPAVARPLRRLIGTSENDATVLEVRVILAFFTKKKAVYAHTSKGDWRIKARMYELEESLPAGDFVRISQSEIVNIAAIKKLDLSFSGTISVQLKDGSRYYVSRRQLPAFKSKLGI
ncbi:LytTR family DNA-binding domain-containing protein [Varibaculum cambriense]|uniref:LytTR family DNA-binding domain-containing protein n=1 Tax=Varibaculum cambriense TaxID=184870 RepID=UPI00290765E9|nr:LytTR family DNA-binding domain-containing protein [Varibaculum cambriense]MDU3274873.1 LytTR family DNA-binding domain-containing protein [Varibaculum cambriense]